MTLPPSGPMQSVFVQARHRAADLLNAGQRDAAIPLLRDLLKQSPRDVYIIRMLGNALSQNTALSAKGTEPEGWRLLNFAHRLAPNDPEILADIASQGKTLGRVRDAHQSLDKALKLSPHHPRSVMIKASLLQSGNRIDEAVNLVEEAMRHTNDPSLPISFAQLCMHNKEYAKGVDALRPLVDRTDMEKLRRQEMFFILGQLYDKLNEFDEAFKCFETANTMQGRDLSSNFDVHLDQWTKEFLDSVPKADVDGSRSVLIVGMPRSGTTLTEMILAAHPKVSGIGESDLINRLAHRKPSEELVDRRITTSHGEEYLGMLDELVPDETMTRVVDKMPENFIYLGLASKILPGASFIHCKRDARDTCLSIYFQAFGPWVKYARAQDTVAKQYLGYLRTMEHWKNTLDVKIHDSVYEELTANPEPHIRALIDHIGMPFNDACLEPHKTKKNVHTASIAQVRNPIYRSSNQRWKNYEKHIGPMLELLADV